MTALAVVMQTSRNKHAVMKNNHADDTMSISVVGFMRHQTEAIS